MREQGTCLLVQLSRSGNAAAAAGPAPGVGKTRRQGQVVATVPLLLGRPEAAADGHGLGRNQILVLARHRDARLLIVSRGRVGSTASTCRIPALDPTSKGPRVLCTLCGGSDSPCITMTSSSETSSGKALQDWATERTKVKAHIHNRFLPSARKGEEERSGLAATLGVVLLFLSSSQRTLSRRIKAFACRSCRVAGGHESRRAGPFYWP
jgi:hypothetical protein